MIAMKLVITNTKTKKKEPIKKKDITTLYGCGITPYDYAHMGHARCYVLYDLLYRILKQGGYNPLYVRNITDVDDKLINRAIKEYNDPHKFLDIANFYYDCFSEDLKKLGCLKPDLEPRATDFINKIIHFIDMLIQKGSAYIIPDDGVYFNINSFQDYGLLSKRNLKEQQVGSRIEINLLKKNPMDFALWKNINEEPMWQSPWGKGRPGWHIECSAMSVDSLKKGIDIHGGGMDLIFPHHENELAQSTCYNQDYEISLWMHCAFISIDNEKMSKSLGNTIFIKDILKKYHPMVLRYMLLIHHYTHPINFSYDLLDHAQKEYKKIVNLLSFDLNNEKIDLTNEEKKIMDLFLESIFDDLNAQRAMGIFFEYINVIKESYALRFQFRSVFEGFLGLDLILLENENDNLNNDLEIKKLLEDREIARKEKNFKRADEIRDLLIQKGYKVQDKKI
jgi:cysteinyl-tRNA synthetase